MDGRVIMLTNITYIHTYTQFI